MKLRRFLVAVLVTALSVVMLWAAVWQFQRGVDRIAELERFKALMQQAPVAIAANELPATRGGQVVRLSGQFDGVHQILLDNQTREGQFGYRVWTVLRSGEANVLVDRGWVAGSSSRESLPTWQTAEQAVDVTGHWRSLPQAGIATGGNPCPVSRWPVRLHYPQAETLACVLDRPLVPGLFQLLPESAHGFARDVELPGLPPERHFAYAGQWAGLTLALWILTWIVWRRRER